ncbi:MAG: hypothetical protein M3Y06_12035, partial [Actinomycetota bacterium]|nr:hypothetical protein [Actinomycetota bacterium]
ASALVDSARENFQPTRELLRDLAPFLQTQQDLGPRTLATVRDLDSFTHQLVLSNSDLIGLLHEMTPLSQQLVALERDLTPTLHVLLANLTSTAQVIDVYLPGLRQTLTVYPALVATLIGFAQTTAATGSIPLYFHLNANDPGICTTGFLPITGRRDPSVTSTTNTPTGLYCKKAAAAPQSVRGTRNTPCLNNPGTRAATPAACLGLPEPTGNIVGGYDPRTGKMGMPDGSTYTVANAPGGQQPARTWQEYLLGTVGK